MDPKEVLLTFTILQLTRVCYDLIVDIPKNLWEGSFARTAVYQRKPPDWSQENEFFGMIYSVRKRPRDAWYSWIMQDVTLLISGCEKMLGWH